MKGKSSLTAVLAAVFAIAIVSGCSAGKAPSQSSGGLEAHDKANRPNHVDHSKGGQKAGPEAAAPQELKPQETCPVMGGKITKDVYADYNGQRVYFCCPGCEKTFMKSPETYLAKMKSLGQKPEQLK